MLTVVLPILWITFDVAICLRTAFMSKPMSWMEIVVWGCVGLALGLIALSAGWYEREQAHGKEIKYERDRAELQAQIQHFSGYNQGAFDRMGRKLDAIAAASSPQIKEEVDAVRSELVVELAERKAREWPRLTPEQKNRLSILLRRTPEHEVGERRIVITRNELPDIVYFANDLAEVFKTAGWELQHEPDRAWKLITPGIHVRGPNGHPGADLLVSSLSEILGTESVMREIVGSPLPQFFDRAFTVQMAVGRNPLR
jgi:hypothetical protein